MPTFDDVENAYNRIKNIINNTSVLTSRTFNRIVDANVFFKCENFQRGGSFKFRGVTNKLLLMNETDKNKGIITHSSGNHAQAVALACNNFNLKSIIVMPNNSPKVKVDAVKEYGSEVVFCENNVKARENTCNNLIKKHGYTLIHPYDDDQIIAGAGTAAYELINKIGDFDYVFCPVGGGGLLSGTSIITKGLLPNSKVIAVEPEKADDAYRSFKDGILYPSNYPSTIADGLRTSLSKRTFGIIRENVDKIITVSEEEIIDAMKFLWERMKIVVEPSGAVSVAGVKKYKKYIKNKKIGLIISGGNINLENFFNNFYSGIKKL